MAPRTADALVSDLDQYVQWYAACAQCIVPTSLMQEVIEYLEQRGMSQREWASRGGKTRASRATKAELSAAGLKAVTARWAKRKKP